MVSATISGNVKSVNPGQIVLEHCFRHDGWSSPKVVTVTYAYQTAPEIGSTLTCAGVLSEDGTQLDQVRYVSQEI